MSTVSCHRNVVLRRGEPPSVFAVAGIVAVASAVVRVSVSVEAYLPPHNPPWPPTYNLSESLVTMQCNSSGYSDVDRASQFGIVSYDWSNAKAQWAKGRPMDCEERLLEQAERLVAAKNRKGSDANGSANSHVFVYRNIVKALPWFSTVRAKLIDPSYEGFFLKFATNQSTAHSGNPSHVPACAAENASVCSDFYHDQEQTPQVPTPENPNPDGRCGADVGCDCGPGLPCGEYYFDHRNGTMLRRWLIEEVVLGAVATDAEGGTRIDGLFLDDYWCSDILCHESNNTIGGCPCDDPGQGPTEANRYAVADTGLSDSDVRKITLEWNKTMELAERALLGRGSYTWWLMDGQENANAEPFLFGLDDGTKDQERHGENLKEKTRSERCTEILEEACRDDSDWQTRPRLFGLSINQTTHALLQFDLDLAFFLLVRGPYSWLGWGQWGMTWPFQAEPAHGESPPLPHGVPLPHELTPKGAKDYGTPLGVCYQRETSSGIFRREWSNGWLVEIDCKHKRKHDEDFEGGPETFEIQQQITPILNISQA